MGVGPLSEKGGITDFQSAEAILMPDHNRRNFLAAAAATLPVARAAHAAGGDTLKVGLVGCGPRGTGAAVNALRADKNVRLTAMADLFPDMLQASLRNIRREASPQVAVDQDHCFLGFDAYKRLIASGVDVVLLALPTYFHPIYLKACVDAGKHVFCEKIHAVDAPGVRMVLAAGEEARRKGLSIVSGLAWRYHTGVRETMKRVHDGAIGQILTIQEICNTGSLRRRLRRPEWSEMEYQIRDWYNFFWLAGDLPGLNLVHNMDKAAWAMHEEPPVRAYGLGGRQTRTGPEFGDAFDHHAMVFEYASGTRMFAYCRQEDGCWNEVSDRFWGTKGFCDLLRCRIEGAHPWRYTGPECNRFDLEHVALFSSIRSGKPINNSLYMARSSMLALMATQVVYTGQVLRWDEAFNSNEAVVPKRLAMDAEPPTMPDAKGRYPLPVPGVKSPR